MKTKITLVLLLTCIIVKAQNAVFALKSSTKDEIYYSFDEAYEAAEDGDTIYVPEITVEGTKTIEKTIKIVGVGSDDSVGNTSKFTDFYLNSSVELESVYAENVYIQAADIVVNKCYISNTLWINSDSGDDNLLINNYIGRLFIYTNSSTNNTFKNNKIFGHAGGGIDYSIFENNFFITNITGIGQFDYSSFKNNIFYGTTINVGDNINNTNTSVGNVSLTGTDTETYFTSYPNDLTLTTPSSTLGIYNGDYPFKDTMYPFAPVVLEDNSTLDLENQQLHFNIKVATQNN